MSSVTVPPVQVGAGIDYITATSARPSSVGALMLLGSDLLAQELGGGGVFKPWHWQGFSGSSCGGVSAGFDGHRAVVRASGAAARECAKDIVECADNVSRLDVQVTVRSDGFGADYASKLYSSLLRDTRGRGRPIAKTLITSNYTGDTLYLGRRISDSYGRIYNKSAEEKCKEDPPRWRYEVEFKRKQALAYSRSYSSALAKDNWCVGAVVEWFGKRHCDPPCSPVHWVGLRGNSRGSDSQAKQLQWLKVGVRPVLCRLALEFGWPDILSMLGVPMIYSEKYINETICQEDD